MQAKQANNNNVVLTSAECFALVFVLFAIYYKYRESVDAIVHSHNFIWLVISGVVFFGLLFYAIAHSAEKLFNRIRMWQLGIKVEEKQAVNYPFISFDLKKELDRFYKDGQNLLMTFVGLNAEKNNKEVVSVSDIQRCQHMQVLGMIGTGKTSSVFLSLIYQDALKKRPIIIIDAKGEESFIEQINGMLTQMGRADDFLLFSLAHKDKSCSFNPLYVGECDPQVIIESFFSNYKDENSFYRQMSKAIFIDAFCVLHSLGKPFTVMDVYAYLNDNVCRKEINDLVEKSGGDGALNLKILKERIISLTKQYKDWKHVITGFNNYLWDYKDKIFDEADSDIIFTDVIRRGQVVYLQLPTNSYPIAAPNIARLAQAHLRYISSLVQTGKLPKDILISVNIDEYGSFAEEFFVEVNNKARDSGMMITIAHQSSGDLSQVSESFKKRMEDSTLNKIYFKEGDHEHCEGIAQSLGTREKNEHTYRMTGGRFGNQIYTGESSSRKINVFNFHPDKIKNLHQYGQAYFIYRGNNSQKCVNFGQFQNLTQIPFEKKSKKNKKEGLRLFEKYYIKTNRRDEPPEGPKSPEDKMDIPPAK